MLTFLETCDANGEEITRALNDAYDMSRPEGRFFLRNAAKEANRLAISNEKNIGWTSKDVCCPSQ